MKSHEQMTPHQEALAEGNLCVAPAAVRTPEELRADVRNVCTPPQMQAMVKRWAVVDPLERSVPYRGIHRCTEAAAP